MTLSVSYDGKTGEKFLYFPLFSLISDILSSKLCAFLYPVRRRFMGIASSSPKSTSPDKSARSVFAETESTGSSSLQTNTADAA